ncbi:MAG TPA: endonuclease/exonuclease/phosphatase family protein, partial [Mycobacteriales bacterium]|nr:endonuclease/exonuclease/phosphatase family protein [Mycobacteriales bacterium]
WKSDFIELANRGESPIDLTGWSVQYHSRGATGTWQVTPLSGELAAGGRYLVAESTGQGGTKALPAPAVTGTIAMSATDGTVALVHATAPLTCGQDCTDANDLVGFGAAAISEGSPIAGASNTLSVQRSTAADTDDNSADFAAAEPTPGAANSGGGPAPQCPAQPGPARIHDIQGDTWISPYDGKTVADVPGVVTAVRSSGSSRGFWIQDTRPDSDPATSEGVFVFTGSGPLSIAAGDAVMVSGKVQDYYPLASGETLADTSNLSTTEIGSATVAVCSTGNPVPAAEVIKPDSIPDTYAPATPSGNIEDLGSVDPSRSTLDFWESREGMRVEVDDARVTGPGNQYGEIYVTAKPDEFPTPRGGTLISDYDKTPTGRIVVTPVSGSVPPANVGDTLDGATVGPVDYSLYGGYALAATQIGADHSGGITKQSADPQQADQLAVATYNVENLSPKDPQSKFAALADGVVTHLASPDVVALEEIQDNDGPTDDGVVAADKTLDEFVQAIVAAGGPHYEWRQISPQDKTDGGQPGGNIRVAFLYNPARVSFVDRPGGDATTATTVRKDTDGTAALSLSPGRVDPTNEAWADSRKPLAGEFRFQGKKVIVVANHFDSKLGDQNADGRFQPPARSSEIQRQKQATAVHDFVQQILNVDQHANVVVAGDLNDYQFSPALKTLTGSGRTLTDLVTTLPVDQQYTYVYNGVSQVLDHILVSPAVSDVDYQVVHINSEFSDQVSDHDPQVVRIRPAMTCTTTISGPHAGSVRANAGGLCLQGAVQAGPVTVTAGAALSIENATIAGPVSVTGATSVRICGSRIAGPLTIQGTTGLMQAGGPGCAANRISGPVRLSGNTGGVITR